MASVRKREWEHNGVKKSAWVVDYKDPTTGKRKLYTPTSGLKKDAETAKRRIESEIEQGVHTPQSESMTLGEAIDQFLRHCDTRRKKGTMTGNGYASYAYGLGERMWTAALLKKKIVNLTSEDIQVRVDALVAEGLSSNTVSRAYVSMVGLLKHCVAKKWIKRNILIDQPCDVPRKERRTEIPTKDEIRILLAETEGNKHWGAIRTQFARRLAVVLGVFCGLRPGEIHGLQWSDVDMEDRTISVRHSFSRFDGLKDPKTEAGVRRIPMPDVVADILQEIARYNAVERFVHSQSKHSKTRGGIAQRLLLYWRAGMTPEPIEQAGYVMLSRTGKNYDASTYHELWKALMRDCGLMKPCGRRVKFTPHALRHAAASLMIAEGLDAFPLKNFMGHASINTTYNVYGHLFPDDVRTKTASEVIANQFASARQGGDGDVPGRAPQRRESIEVSASQS